MIEVSVSATSIVRGEPLEIIIKSDVPPQTQVQVDISTCGTANPVIAISSGSQMERTEASTILDWLKQTCKSMYTLRQWPKLVLYLEHPGSLGGNLLALALQWHWRRKTNN